MLVCLFDGALLFDSMVLAALGGFVRLFCCLSDVAVAIADGAVRLDMISTWITGMGR